MLEICKYELRSSKKYRTNIKLKIEDIVSDMLYLYKHADLFIEYNYKFFLCKSYIYILILYKVFSIYF